MKSMRKFKKSGTKKKQHEQKNLYAVIGTDVLVSALLSSNEEAATVQVVKKLLAGAATPLLNNNILQEYNEVLRRPKFNFSPQTVSDLLYAMEQSGVIVNPVPSGEQLPDIKDLPFYEVVLEKSDENAYLVTGNGKHFPVKPFIVTPREFFGNPHKIKIILYFYSISMSVYSLVPNPRAAAASMV